MAQARVAALHVRLAISNDGDATPWTLTTSDQLRSQARAGVVRSSSHTDVQTLPTVTIIRRKRRVLDFYYPLPASIRDEQNLPAFDFRWQVTTPARPFASRTHFSGSPRVIVTQPPRGHYRAIRDHRR